MEKIKGYVDHIIYTSEQTGFTVLSFSTTEEDIIVVGTFPGVEEGETLIINGEYTIHPTYGRQIKAESFESTQPSDISGIEHYLQSGSVKGVGKATAKRIVSKFKEDTFRIIEEEPHRLAEIKGISLKKAISIADQVMEKKELRDVIIFLDGYGIGSAMALKIYRKFGTEVYRIIRENPYRLADDVDGIGFITADKIALRMNMDMDSDYRIKAAIIFVLNKSLTEGHTFIRRENLRMSVGMLLKFEVEPLDNLLMNLVIDKKIVIKEDRVYLSAYFYMEKKCAEMLLGLSETFSIDERKLNEAIDLMEEKKEIKLDDLQRDAVRTAVSNGVCVITGGPGTGKTTTIRTILEFFELEGMEIFLAAPTGRAAKRMTEATMRGAKTIHRMLEVKGMSDGDSDAHSFERNGDNPLECDVVIIDEMSMVDISLFYHLLSAIEVGTRIIMVGDKSQLPSVGPGNVLKDIISTEKFAVVTLDKVFRQSDESDIVENAFKINHGEHIDFSKKSDDFFFVERRDVNKVTDFILNVIGEKLPEYVGTDSYNVQLLSPSKKGYLGVPELNKTLQKHLNPPAEGKAEKEFGDRIFRVGDKVMQIKNNYQIEWNVYSEYNIPIDSGTGVFNGDMGIITDINKATSTVRVLFDDERAVDYTFSELTELEHAYAVTVHKSQGSEYPAVIIPLLKMAEPLMTRNILYTAITRARKCVVIVGSKEVFERMIDNATIAKRNSSLDICISELTEKNR